MEDIKKIQEFFSKPLEEISTDNIGMKQQYILTEPVQIAYTDSFGTGMTNSKGVLHQANAGYFIGEEDAYVIILPGGTFYVSEDGEVAMRIWPIRDQSNEFGAALAKTPFAPKYADWRDKLKQSPVKEDNVDEANVSWSTLHSSPPESDLIASDIQKAMNQNKGDEAIIHQLKIARRKMNVGNLKKAKEITSRYLKEADLNDPVAVKMRAAKMKADKLAKMRKANAGDDGNDKFFEKSTKIAALEKGRRDLMRDMEQEAEPEGGPIADEYGRKLNRIDAAIAKLSGRKEMDYDTAVGKVNEYDVNMPSQEQVDKFFALTQQETHYLNSKPVAGQEGTFNLMKVEPWDEYDLSNFNSLVRKAKEKKSKFKKHGEMSGFDMRGIDELEIGDEVKIDKNYGGGKGEIEDKIGSFVVVNGKSYHESDVEEILRELTSLKAEKGYSPQLVSPENPKGETDGLTTDTMNKILMKIIQDLDESSPGLWDNIRAKRERGEKPARKGSKAYKTAVKAGRKINKAKN